jgi:hypothetical protein
MMPVSKETWHHDSGDCALKMQSTGLFWQPFRSKLGKGYEFIFFLRSYQFTQGVQIESSIREFN